MRAALGLRVEDVPARCIDWPAIGPEIEDLIARHARVDGDQVALFVYEADDEDGDIDELVVDFDDDDPWVVDVPVGAYL